MNKTIIQPYLFFNGRCEEALETYKSAIGAQVDELIRFKDSPEPPPPGMVPDGWEEKIMHATFRIGDSVLMASDGCEPDAQFSGFSLSLTVATEKEAVSAFQSLSDGGEITMPLDKTFFSPLFGMATDRFGVGWMVNVESENQ